MSVLEKMQAEISKASPRTPAHAATQDASRRLKPRVWDTDWLVMRGLAAAVAQFTATKTKPGEKILDFGCGTMPYKPLFAARQTTYLGADFDPSSDVFISPDGQVAAPDRSVDTVVSFQVLEHVRSLDTYLGEARRLLKDDGHLLLSTHGVWLYHPHPEDHRRWTRTGLTLDIEARGFTVEDCIPLVGPLAWTTMVRLTCLAVVLRSIPVVGPALTAIAATVMNAKALIEDKITPDWVTRDNASVYVMIARPDKTQ